MARRPPWPGWARDYQRGWLRGDLLAGVTVTAYLIPQVMAYAEVAGLPAVAGLWASVGALVAYAAPRLVAAAVGRAGVDHGADDGGGDRRRWRPPAPRVRRARRRAVPGRGRAAACSAGSAGWPSSPTCSPGRCWSATWPGSPSIMVVSQLGKLTGIHGRRRTASSRARVRRRAISARCTSRRWCSGCGHARRDARRQRLFPRAPMALIGMLGAAAAVALLDLQARGRHRHRRDPRRAAGAGAARTSLDGVRVAAAGRPRRRVRRLHRQRPHRPRLRRPAATSGSTPSGSCSRSARPTSAPGCMHGFPVSSSGSRTAIGDAVGGRTQLTSLVTVAATVLAVLARCGRCWPRFPTAALGAVVVYAAVRLVDVAEFRRLAAFRRSELLLALGHHGRRAGGRGAPRRAGRHRALGRSTCCAGSPARTTPSRASCPTSPACTTSTTTRGADRGPGAGGLPLRLAAVLRQRRGLPPPGPGRGRRRRTTRCAWFVLNAEAIVEVDITAVDALEDAAQGADRRAASSFALARVKQDLRDDLAADRPARADRRGPPVPDAADGRRGVPAVERGATLISPRCDVREVRPLGGPGAGSRSYVEDN